MNIPRSFRSPPRPGALAILACAALATWSPSVEAQGLVAPAIVRAKQSTPGLSASALGVSSVWQIHLVRLPGDPIGIWSCSLSVRGLSTARGGRGGMDLLIGRYDVRRDVFTPNLAAANCNSTADEFDGMFDASGRHYVFDRNGTLPAQIMYTNRDSTTAQFGTPLPVDGVPVQKWFDPSIGVVDGTLQLFYTEGASVVRAPFDPDMPSVVGPSHEVVRPSRTGATVDSATPIFDARGMVTGLVHCEFLGSDNDAFLTPDLDPATPSHPLLDTTGWTNNGGYAGGTFFFAERGGIVNLQTNWMTASSARIGEPMALQIMSPPGSNAISLPFVGLSYLGNPIRLPGFTNALGIAPQTLIPLLAAGNDPRTGIAGYSFLTPLDPTLTGLELPMQSLVTGLASRFTNTSVMRISTVLPPNDVKVPNDGKQHDVEKGLKDGEEARTLTVTGKPVTVVALDDAGVEIPGSKLPLPVGRPVIYDIPGAKKYAVVTTNLPSAPATVVNVTNGPATTTLEEHCWKPGSKILLGKTDAKLLKFHLRGTIKAFLNRRWRWVRSECPAEIQITDGAGYYQTIPIAPAQIHSPRRNNPAKKLVKVWLVCKGSTGVCRVTATMETCK